MSFIEITVADGHGEFMVHLDESGEPIRMYAYVKDLGSWPKDKSYDEDEAEWAEREVFHKARYRPGRNPLFWHARSKVWVKRVWEAYLRKWVSQDDEIEIENFMNKIPHEQRCTAV